MINPKELRIGNLIQYGSNPNHVISVDESLLIDLLNGINHEIYPITLTEDVLLTIGFHKELHRLYETPIYMWWGLILSINSPKASYEEWEKWRKCYTFLDNPYNPNEPDYFNLACDIEDKSFYPFKFRYLHEIQNAIFYLGTELI